MTVKAIVAILVVLGVVIYLAVGLFGDKQTLPAGEDAGVDHPGVHADFGAVTQGPDGNPVNTAAPAGPGTGERP